MKKKDVNYRVIMGMKAVGNQCQNCQNKVHDTRGTMGCKALNTQVSPKAHCDLFERES